MGWVRSGYCCRCGECCVGDPYAGNDEQRPSELMKRAPPVEGYCPLYEIRDGQGFCAGHVGVAPEGQEDPYYMAGCVAWPSAPDNIAGCPSCTYTFTWVDD